MIQHLWRKIVTAGVLILMLGLAAGAVPPQMLAAPAPQNGPTTWTVLVGGEAGIDQQAMGPAGAWQFMRFYPDSITINAGDTIVWKLASAEPHTVTFTAPGEQPPALIIPEGGDSQRMLFNPLSAFPQGGSDYDGTALTSSGQMGMEPQFPKEYSLTFTTPGSYEYFCLFHTMMTGKVTVQEAGSPYPKTQAEIDADAAAQLAADTQAAKSAEPEAMQGSTRPGPDGTTIHEVNMGYGDGTMAWMRFGPADLTINVGDTVEWTQKDVETPHTVTLTSGGAEPEPVLAEPQPDGPPKLILNPEVLAPAGGDTYSGQGYFNSGLVWGTEAPLPGSRTYSLTFDTPGTYEYICVLHDPMGMVGQVTVQAQGAPAELPTTGSALQTSIPWWLVVAGLGLVAAGLLLLGARRKGSMLS